MENRFVRQTFNSSGSWTCPAGITKVILWGMGGGAGGGGGQNATASAGGNGGYGGAGVALQMAIVDVVPNTTYTITIGAGGTGGPNNATAATSKGTAGGDTSFGALFTWKGAPTNGTVSLYKHYTSAARGYSVLSTTSSLLLGSTSGNAANFNFGANPAFAYHGLRAARGTFTQSTTTGAEGAGGCSGEGIGGAGGSNAGAGAAGTNGSNAAANTGAGGGGGAGGSTVSQNGGSGGNGGSGQLIVTWVE